MRLLIMRLLGLLGLLCSLIVPATALNREAFTITRYALEVRLEPQQQRLGARGKITLRNDSGQPQKVAALQISSSLNWRSKWGVKRLLCEGGGELNDALFRAGLVDEIHLTICPKIFGGRTAPTIADGLGFQR